MRRRLRMRRRLERLRTHRLRNHRRLRIGSLRPHRLHPHRLHPHRLLILPLEPTLRFSSQKQAVLMQVVKQDHCLRLRCLLLCCLCLHLRHCLFQHLYLYFSVPSKHQHDYPLILSLLDILLESQNERGLPI